MTSRSENPCRAALVDALTLLDEHGHDGAACYVAMALDALRDRYAGSDAIPAAVESQAP
jgi:hypothetical protein